MGKRILVISNFYPNRGGISGAVEELVRDLRHEGYRIKIASTAKPLKQRLLGVLKAIRLAREADVLFATGSAHQGMLPMVVAGVIARLFRKPVLHNFHDGQAEVFLDEHAEWVRPLLAENPVIVATEFVAQAFRKHQMNAVVIPNHFNFEQAFHQREAGKAQPNRILWARQFLDLYQPEFALKAAHAALEQEPSLDFHFYGDGELLEDLKSRYAHSNIHFHGRAPRDEFLKAYESFSILYNTTKFDNFPLSIVEAGVNGLLVITTRIGGPATLYSDEDVVFVENDDVKALSEHLVQAVRSPQLYRKYRESLARKIQEFTWEAVRADYLSLIEGNKK